MARRAPVPKPRAQSPTQSSCPQVGHGAGCSATCTSARRDLLRLAPVRSRVTARSSWRSAFAFVACFLQSRKLSGCLQERGSHRAFAGLAELTEVTSWGAVRLSETVVGSPWDGPCPSSKHSRTLSSFFSPLLTPFCYRKAQVSFRCSI